MGAARLGLRLLAPPVLAVISLMAFVYYATVFVFLQDWLGGLAGSAGILNALAFSWIALMSLLSFFVAALTDPGRVPPSFSPEAEDPQKAGGHSRYCNKCCSYKPPRTHHCRVCKRCVLKMDHHCVWIGNCVGYANYKPFIIFVLHATLGSIYSMVIFISSVLMRDHEIKRISIKIFDVFCGSIIVILSMTTSTLLVWHIYLLSYNMTTIEYREVVRAKWFAKKRGQQYRHPFDLGVYNNVSLSLGTNMMKWLCPIAMGHLKDGIQFPISNE